MSTATLRVVLTKGIETKPLLFLRSWGGKGQEQKSPILKLTLCFINIVVCFNKKELLCHLFFSSVGPLDALTRGMASQLY